MLHSNNPNNKSSELDPFGISPIKGFISQINKRIQHLAELLKQEHELLIHGTADQISEAAEDKLDCMHELSLFIANYFNDEVDNNNSINRKLEFSLQSVNEICIKNKIKEWNKIRELINYCRELSDKNSILLANRLKFTNNAIDTLYSLAGTSQSKIYDDKGLSQQSRSSRQLASA